MGMQRFEMGKQNLYTANSSGSIAHLLLTRVSSWKSLRKLSMRDIDM